MLHCRFPLDETGNIPKVELVAIWTAESGHLAHESVAPWAKTKGRSICPGPNPSPYTASSAYP